MRVNLPHRDLVFSPVEDLDLIGHLHPTSAELLLFSRHYDDSSPLGPLPQSGRLLLIGVVVDNEWKPQLEDFIICQRIQCGLLLQDVKLNPVIRPFQEDLELEVNGMLNLLHGHDLHQDYGYSDRDGHQGEVCGAHCCDGRHLLVVVRCENKNMAVIFI